MEPLGRILQRESVLGIAAVSNSEPALKPGVAKAGKSILLTGQLHGCRRIHDPVSVDDEVAVPGIRNGEAVPGAVSRNSFHDLRRRCRGRAHGRNDPYPSKRFHHTSHRSPPVVCSSVMNEAAGAKGYTGVKMGAKASGRRPTRGAAARRRSPRT